MNNLIEQLKNNKYPFGLMSEEMQEKARQIGQNRFWKYLMSEDGEQCGFMDAKSDFDEYKSLVYRLRPDYKDEPEIREMEISGNNSNCLCMYNDEGQNFGSIAKVHERADFIGFKFADGTVMGSPVKYSVPGITSHGYWASYEDLKTSQARERHAICVLFRRKKQE